MTSAATLYACERVGTLIPSEPDYARVRASLPEARRRKCDELRPGTARTASAAAWLLLRRLAAARGLDADRLALVENAFGKVDFAPAAGFHFNLSHSHDRVMAALSVAPVGCDVERIAPIRPGVPEECLSRAELALLASVPGPERPRAFTRLWTRKESLGKAMGCGLGTGPRELEVLRDEVDGQWMLDDFDGGDGYWCGICTARGAADRVRLTLDERT